MDSRTNCTGPVRSFFAGPRRWLGVGRPFDSRPAFTGAVDPVAADGLRRRGAPTLTSGPASPLRSPLEAPSSVRPLDAPSSVRALDAPSSVRASDAPSSGV